jgi:hypothetical protein
MREDGQPTEGGDQKNGKVGSNAYVDGQRDVGRLQ